MKFSRGDTLIEVLLAIVIVSTTLGGAYASSSQSLHTTQTTKERDIAIRVAETQLERIRGATSNNPLAFNGLTSSDGFCVNESLVIRDNTDGGPGSAGADSLRAIASGGQYHAECIVDSSGATPPGTRSTPFYIYNTKNAENYLVHVRWARSGGGTNQEIKLRYRLY